MINLRTIQKIIWGSHLGEINMYGKNDHVRIVSAIAKGLAEGNNLKNYLELGIRKGPCFNEIAPLCNGSAYAVDINNKSLNFIKQNKNLKWFCSTTNDFFSQLDKNIKFDLIFIDADHSHKSSMEDFENAKNHIHENHGLILLHDTFPPEKKYISPHYCSDTYKTAWEIRNKYKEDFEIVTLPFYFGVSIVRKANKQIPLEI